MHGKCLLPIIAYFATGTIVHEESEVLKSCAIPQLLSRILQQEPRRICAGFGIVNRITFFHIRAQIEEARHHAIDSWNLPF
jgi:hypothetical protein